MSIRPIDLQVMLPKTAEYAKQPQNEINKQNFDQQMFTQTAAKELEHKQSMVVETNESEQFVNKDGRNKQEQEKKKRNKRGNEDKGEEKNKKNAGSGLFDMRI